jgi:hypothetical protein
LAAPVDSLKVIKRAADVKRALTAAEGAGAHDEAVQPRDG